MPKKRVLIIFYSFTQQTKVQLKKFAAGLESAGIEVGQERLEPLAPYEFPFKSNIGLAMAMISTFFRRRMTIRPVAEHCFDPWDCIVLAGPTWSYHPSGPMLDFLDRYGRQVCGGRVVIPFISCRSYWQLHYWSIKGYLRRCGARVEKPVVFTHPIREPWRLIGLVLQLRGKMVRRENSWFRRHYPGYGHSRQQGVEAQERGRALGQKLLNDLGRR